MFFVKNLLRCLGFPQVPVGMETKVYIEHVFDVKNPGTSMEVTPLYRSLPMPSGTDDGRLHDLSTSKVVELQLCKVNSSPQHEFVLATIHHPGNKAHPRYLRLERTFHPTTLRHSSNISSAKQSKPDANPARDLVVYFDNKEAALAGTSKHKVHVCWIITFLEGEDPDFIELVSAAETLHRAAPNYNVVNRMCYWLAYSLVAVLTHNRKHSAKTASKEAIPGCFFRIPILKANNPPHPEGSLPASEDVAEYHERFLVVVEDIKKLIVEHEAPIIAKRNAAAAKITTLEERNAVVEEERDAAVARMAALEEKNAALKRQLEAAGMAPEEVSEL